MSPRVTTETADTRRAGCFASPLREPCGAFGGGSKANVCTLYLVFKEPRTRGLQPLSPADRAIQSTWISLRPFWGNLSNLRRLSFPVNPFFRIAAKNLWGDLLRAARCSRPRTSRQSRLPNVGDRRLDVNTRNLRGLSTIATYRRASLSCRLRSVISHDRDARAGPSAARSRGRQSRRSSVTGARSSVTR